MQASGTTTGWSAAVAAILLGAFLLAACGGGDNGGEDSAPSPEELAGCIADAETIEPCLADLSACVIEAGVDSEVVDDGIRLQTETGLVEMNVFGTATSADAVLEEVESSAAVGQIVAERGVIDFELAAETDPDEAIAAAQAQEQGVAAIRDCLGADPAPAETVSALVHCLRAGGHELGAGSAAYGGSVVIEAPAGDVEVQLYNDAAEAQEVIESDLLGSSELVTETASISAGAFGEEVDAARACLEGEPTATAESEPSATVVETPEFTFEIPADYEEVEVNVEKGTAPNTYYETIYQSPDGAHQLSVSRNPDKAGGNHVAEARAFGKLEAEGGKYEQFGILEDTFGPYEGANLEYALNVPDASYIVSSYWFDVGEDAYVVKATTDLDLGGDPDEGSSAARTAASTLEPV